MKVLVTGASGQVGQEVTQLFRAKGVEVQACSSQELDITDLGMLDSRLRGNDKLTAVINCAAYTAVDKAEDEQDRAFAVNAIGVENLAKACKATKIPLIHLSTDYVFDGLKAGAYIETDTPNPQNVYGASKLAGEEALRANWEQHIILRVSWVFGRFGNNFVKTISRLAKEREQLKIVADQKGCPTGASHIAEVILHLTKHPANWGTYHYTDAPVTTWFDFAKSFAPKTCELIPITTEEYPVKAARPKNSVLNCDKIARIFGIKQADWQEELAKMRME